MHFSYFKSDKSGHSLGFKPQKWLNKVTGKIYDTEEIINKIHSIVYLRFSRWFLKWSSTFPDETWIKWILTNYKIALPTPTKFISYNSIKSSNEMKKVLIRELDAPSFLGFFGFLVFWVAKVKPSAIEVNSVSRVVTIVVVPSS